MGVPLVFVHGTWSRADPWHGRDSDVTAEARARGYDVYDFLWSGILGGVRPLVVELLQGGDPAEAKTGADQPELLLWLDAGEKLALFCRAHRLDRPHVLSHSHGLQVVTYAAVKGQCFDTAVSVSGPVRDDMRRARWIARDAIRKWIQFFDPINDGTIRAGQAFDGHPGFSGRLPEAAANVDTSGSGHSGLVLDSSLRERYLLWTYFDAA